MKAIYNISLNSSLVAKLFCPHILIHNNFVLQNLNKRDINLIRRIKPCAKCEISVTSKWENECIIKTNSISHIQYMRKKVCTRFVMFCCVGKLSILHTHYDDVRMGAIASQITSLTIVYSTVYSDADQRNIKDPRHWPLCGEFTGIGEFPTQRASYAENVSIWWRHHDSFKLLHCGSGNFQIV